MLKERDLRHQQPIGTGSESQHALCIGKRSMRSCKRSAHKGAFTSPSVILFGSLIPNIPAIVLFSFLFTCAALNLHNLALCHILSHTVKYFHLLILSSKQ